MPRLWKQIAAAAGCASWLLGTPSLATAASFVVNSTGCERDDNEAHFEPRNGVCAVEDGGCTLAAAAFECVGGCTITFAIPTDPTDVPWVCSPLTLPGATYDGTTQPSGFVRIDPDVMPTSGAIAIGGGSVLRGLHLPNTRLGDGSLVEGCVFVGGGGLTIGSSTTVGGVTPAARNEFVGGHDCVTIEGDDNVVEGNHIGLGLDGDATDHNCHAGVVVRKPGAGNRIGGVAPGARNVIVNRGGPTSGVVWIEPGTHDTVVHGNFIGTDPAGMTTLATGAASAVWAGGIGTRIGGAGAGEGNLIVGPGSAAIDAAGVTVDGGPTGSATESAGIAVQGNWIGLDATGLQGLGHFSYGVRLTPTAHEVLIGGTASGAGNVIAGTTVAAVYLDGRLLGGALGTCHDNLVQGNRIGTDATGTAVVGTAIGVRIRACHDNRVGGSEPGAGNVIAADGAAPPYGVGVQIYDTAATNAATGNVVQGNLVGVAPDGTALPVTFEGIDVLGPQTTVGGTVPSAGNVVGNCGGCGVRLRTDDVIVQGNRLGVAPDGVTAAGNGRGVCVEGKRHLVGGIEAEAANLIAHGAQQGVVVTGAFNRGNRILRNALVANHLGIDLGADGVTPNDVLDADEGPNRLQNAPVLTAIEVATGITVHGSLHAAPSGTFRLDFYTSCAADPSAYVEAERWLGTLDVTTSSLGDALYTAFLPLDACHLVTATATDAEGNTSEFSLALTTPTTLPTTSTTTVVVASSTTTTAPCTTARCLLDAARDDVACAGAPLPGPVAHAIDRALARVDAAAVTTPTKARRLLRSARTLLARAARAAGRAARGTRRTMTAECAAVIRTACASGRATLRTE